VKVAIIGAGYVGLVTGACLADAGHTVTVVDKDEARVAALRRDEMPIYEPGLAELVAANTERLSFVTSLAEAVGGADVVFIAVGTPSRRGDGHADLTYVHGAVAELAPLLTSGQVVATKSTVPVGTGDDVASRLAALRPGLDVAVVSNPEFLREGVAIDDFMHPDRIIVGADDEPGRAAMAALYAPFTAEGAPLVVTGRRTAELTKYAANAFLAMKVTFINELADLSEAAGADVTEIARGIGLDQRIGAKFLNAGPGFGGSCFPKDTAALLRTAELFGTPLRLVEATLGVNTARAGRMAKKIIDALGGDPHGKSVALLGLTFKANTDDLRASPAIAVAQVLIEAEVAVTAYDPQGMPGARRLLPRAAFAADPYAAAQDADAVVLATEWDEFKTLDLSRLKSVMRKPVVVDLRNLYTAAPMRAAGFTYRSVGRPGEDV
jgi:UDPglucose 6-dehydrogenase